MSSSFEIDIQKSMYCNYDSYDFLALYTTTSRPVVAHYWIRLAMYHFGMNQRIQR